jgi:thioredoxin-like negative regulator of GroEL
VLDAERNLELGRQAKDPQTVIPAIAFTARAFLEVGREKEASALADELLELDFANSRSGWSLTDVHWVFEALGRTSELVGALEATSRRTPWSEAAAAIVGGDLLRGAEIFAELGHLPNEAYTRLRAAQQLVAEGRRAEADEQLRKALAFYRSIGATRYLREGEALLAAAG